MTTYLDELNPAQKEAVLHTEGPLLIVAGAGAGKTKTLTHRILHLIQQGVAAHNILAITFTNKAAKEMRERVMKLLDNDQNLNRPVMHAGLPFVSTFHSLGVYILREQHQALGLPKRFTIFDRADSKQAVRDAVKACNYDPKQYDPGKILNIISREKGNMTTCEEFEAKAGNEFFRSIVAEVWGKYEKTLAKEGALDFDDLLLKLALLLKNNTEVCAYYNNLWKYIHVDEYQDTNAVQYEITQRLAGTDQNICCVGDGDQTIYTWRGATIENILKFERDYPRAHIVLLEQNYRSTKTIISVANNVIEKNQKRQKKKLFTEGEEGDKVKLFHAFDEADEARFVAKEAEALIKKGIPADEIAVLYRANFQSRALEEGFLKYGVPYQVLGTRFFDRKEVKDVLSYLKAALNPDNMSDIKRVINVPARGIGPATLLKISQGTTETLSPSVREKVQRFFELLGKVRTFAENNKASDVVRFVSKESGFENLYKQDGSEGEERLENIRELVTLATKYDFMPAPEGIDQLINDAALATDQDELSEKKEGVKLLTVHASKGLEFDNVFIAGLEEGLFPHERLDSRKDDEEEERRLFYVALTRARKKLFLTHASMRTIFGSRKVSIPSQFLDDVADEHLEMEESADANPDDDRRSRIRDIFIDF